VLQVGGEGDRSHGETTGADWVVRAQDGRAEEVLAEVAVVLEGDTSPSVRVRALYAQAIALRLLGRTEDAVRVVHALSSLCRDLGLAATGLRARALLAELLRGSGAVGQALEELAHAVAVESGLQSLDDPEAHAALGALAIALRMSGVHEESRRVEARLAEVETRLPVHQRVSRAGNLAFEQAVEAMSAARRPPYRPDVAGLREAVAEIRRGERLARDGEYPLVADEAAVLTALLAAVVGDPQEALDRLDACERVMGLGPAAVMARHLWACARVRALIRLDRTEDAVVEGQRLLQEIGPSPYRADRLALAFEVMRAEEATLGTQAVGARSYLELAEQRMQQESAQLVSLFRARVAALRSADERRLLARTARLDSLTGLVNRRGAAAAVAAASGRPEETPVALLLIDLDGFGRVNDVCGHLAGDVVLQRVAGALRAQTRPEDVVARWNADEFLVLTSLDTDAAVTLADRVRVAIREGGEPAAEDSVTASVGIAVRTGPVVDDDWLRQAELARYAAWRSGGDVTVLAPVG
jgi:diguanylate cyclase (GGDEF)-like protein